MIAAYVRMAFVCGISLLLELLEGKMLRRFYDVIDLTLCEKKYIEKNEIV